MIPAVGCHYFLLVIFAAREHHRLLVLLLLQKVFDDGYYCRNVDKEKPVFTDDEDDGMLFYVSSYTGIHLAQHQFKVFFSVTPIVALLCA